uniref:multiple epidermal growth factor-like domains protein 9 isoform X2 n=1 Tax=Pristiophorus japonicus TaxID=55135 RepID=UPI00398E75F1
MNHLGRRYYSLLVVVSSVALALGQVSTVTVGPTVPLHSTLVPTSTNTNDALNITTSTSLGNVTTPTRLPAAVTSISSNCTMLNTSNCAMCSPGHFPNNGSLNCSCCADGLCIVPEDCLMCPQGYYQSLAGQVTCLPCSKGAYTNSTGSTECQACESGFYANETGSIACRDCLPGYFSAKNAVHCESCSRGLFCNTTNCGECTICPGGEEALSTAAIECTLCRPGMYKQLKELLCRMCKTGYYQIMAGQESCDQCPEQHYCPSPDVAPIHCPDDAFCPAGSTAPQYCMETFFLKSRDQCVLTPLTIFLLVVTSFIILLIITVLIVRCKKEVGPMDPVRSPLLNKEPSPGQETQSSYGISWDREPVYAGW